MTVEEAGKLVTECLLSGGTVFACGNGGSASQAGHFAAELLGWYRMKGRPALACLDLCAMAPALLAIGNDSGFKHVFERQLDAFGHEGDLLIAISTSGNSENVCRAAGMAHALGIDVIALTGAHGGILAKLAGDNVLAAPTDDTPSVQEWHLKALHDIAGYVEKHYFVDDVTALALAPSAAIEGTA